MQLPVAPTITWTTPSAIPYGTALSATQLNATASVPGSFSYSPVAGTVLDAGTQTLSATFTPTDTIDYSATTATVQLTVTQAVPAITWAAPSAILYGTALSATQLNATANVPGSFVYNPAGGTLLPVGSDALSVVFTPTNAKDYTSATDQVTIIVNQPTVIINSLSPAFGSAGGAAFTLTVNGSGFTQSSSVMWNGSAVNTAFVSATQITAQVPAADIANAGTITVTAQNSSPGGTSNSFQFEVDSAGSSSPVFSNPSTTVTHGATAAYPVTLPSGATNVSVTCLNLPAGATCSYSASNSTVSITTSSTTPAGTYAITVVFTETLPGAAVALLLPLLVLPLSVAGKRRGARRIWLALCVFAILGVAAVGIGCGGSGSTLGGGPVQQTHQATSSATVTLIVQ